MLSLTFAPTAIRPTIPLTNSAIILEVADQDQQVGGNSPVFDIWRSYASSQGYPRLEAYPCGKTGVPVLPSAHPL